MAYSCNPYGKSRLQLQADTCSVALQAGRRGRPGPATCGCASTTSTLKAAKSATRPIETAVRDPTTWTIFQQDGPNDLGLR